MKQKPLIFIVEDNTTYKQALIHFLSKNGFDLIHTFTSGEECLKNLYLKPDIIIQDHSLEGINGKAVMQKTKAVLPDTEFIFLSVRDNIEVAVDVVKHGAADYIVKNEQAFQRVLQQTDNIWQQQIIKNKIRLRNYVLIGFVVFLTLTVVFLLYSNH